MITITITTITTIFFQQQYSPLVMMIGVQLIDCMNDDNNNNNNNNFLSATILPNGDAQVQKVTGLPAIAG